MSLASSPPRRPAAAAASSTDESGAPPALPPTLARARTTFLDAVRRDTPGTDLPRYTAVLDALLAWSAERADRVAFRPATGASAGLRFDRVGRPGALWSVRTTPRGAPVLELAPGTTGALTPAGHARALAVINAHSRAVLEPGDRLRIGFGALKNAAACAAVLALCDELLDDGLEPPAGPTTGPGAGPTDAPAAEPTAEPGV